MHFNVRDALSLSFLFFSYIVYTLFSMVWVTSDVYIKKFDKSVVQMQTLNWVFIRVWHCMEAVGNKIFVFGGNKCNASMDRVHCLTTEVYNIKTEQWSTVRPLMTGQLSPGSTIYFYLVCRDRGSDSKSINSLFCFLFYFLSCSYFLALLCCSLAWFPPNCSQFLIWHKFTIFFSHRRDRGGIRSDGGQDIFIRRIFGVPRKRNINSTGL